jgi:capsular exopolysaccharide synthesis family protein
MAMVGLADAPPETRAASNWNEVSDTEKRRLIQALSESVDITRRPLTNILAFSAEAATPERAAQIANAVADAYLAEQIDTKLGASQRAVDFLRERVNELGREIDQQDARIENFIKAKLNEIGTPEARDLLRSTEEARSERGRLASTLAGLQAALDEQDYESMTQFLELGAIDYAAQRRILVDRVAMNSSDQALVTANQVDLAALDSQIRAAAVSRASLLQSQVNAAERNATELRAELEKVLGSQDVPSSVAAELFRMQRDAEVQRSLYSNYLTKLRQLEQSAVFDLPDSRVVAEATPPIASSYPPVKLIGAASLLVALFAGFGAGFVRERYIDGFTSADDLERATGIPVVAAVPRFRRKDGSDYRADWAIVAEPLSEFSEAVRRLRGIEAQGLGEQYSLFVTSAFPEEGKTTLALALGRSLALTGKKTLLIDADLRRPSVGKYIDAKPATTLGQFLSSHADVSDSSLRAIREEATGLEVIVGEEVAGRATDALLLSGRFGDLMARVRASYDVIIIDTSPIGLVVDPQIVSRHCDVGLFVVRQSFSARSTIIDCMRELQSSTDVPLCIALNQVSRQHRSRHGYYGSYYR